MRSVAAMPFSWSTFVKTSIRSTEGRRKPPAPGLYGIRFTWASFVGPYRVIAAASDRAVSTESFTPARRTYSNVTRRFVRFTYRAAAARTSSTPHLRLIGIIRARVGSHGAWRQTRGLTGQPSYQSAAV